MAYPPALFAALLAATALAAQSRLAPPTDLRVNGVTSPADSHICFNAGGPDSDEGLTLGWRAVTTGSGPAASAFIVNVTGEIQLDGSTAPLLWSRCVPTSSRPCFGCLGAFGVMRMCAQHMSY